MSHPCFAAKGLAVTAELDTGRPLHCSLGDSEFVVASPRCWNYVNARITWRGRGNLPFSLL